MPVRVRWFQGKHLGVALMFFGIAGLLQTIFIIHGQFLMGVGSDVVVTLIPIIVTFAIGYSCAIIYEAQLQRERQDQFRKGYKKHTSRRLQGELLLPLLIPLGAFIGIYLIGFVATQGLDNALSSFLIAENSAAIGVLLIASLLENYIAPNLKHY